VITLGPLAAIADAAAKGFEIDGHSLLVIRRDGHIYAYRNSCPHLGIELNWVPDQFLDRAGDLIQCSTHGALFRIEDGSCIAGPCRGKHLQAIRCAVSDGQITLPEWPSG
jgi:nitrite reductase/ring-hydroxylating ferredoxin subunit